MRAAGNHGNVSISHTDRAREREGGGGGGGGGRKRKECEAQCISRHGTVARGHFVPLITC